MPITINTLRFGPPTTTDPNPAIALNLQLQRHATANPPTVIVTARIQDPGLPTGQPLQADLMFSDGRVASMPNWANQIAQQTFWEPVPATIDHLVVLFYRPTVASLVATVAHFAL